MGNILLSVNFLNPPTDIMLLCRLTVISLFTDPGTLFPETHFGLQIQRMIIVKILSLSTKMMVMWLFITTVAKIQEMLFGAQELTEDKVVTVLSCKMMETLSFTHSTAKLSGQLTLMPDLNSSLYFTENVYNSIFNKFYFDFFNFH